MKQSLKNNWNNSLRKKRNRAKIFGTAVRPRLSVFRSNMHVSVQLINDEKGVTLAQASTRELKAKAKKTEQALQLGGLIAERALKAGIKEVVFNKGAYLYHGRVKAVAEGARAKGLKI